MLFLSGCAQPYHLRIDALSRSPAPEGAAETVPYLLTSADPAMDPADLQFAHASGLIERALAANGYHRVTTPSLAAMEVELSLALSDPQQVSRNTSKPIYVYQHGYSRIDRVPVRNDKGQIVDVMRVRTWVPGRNEFAGFVDQSRQITVYEKKLTLSARPIRSNGERGPEDWRLEVLLQDPSTDLRGALPYLAAGAMAYVDRETDGQVVVPLTDDDESVVYIRGM